MKKILAMLGVVAIMAASSAYAAENPCAMKGAMKGNPCAMKANPCGVKNPCDMKQHKKQAQKNAKEKAAKKKAANPCAANPCAAKK